MDVFRARTGLDPSLATRPQKIVSLRDLAKGTIKHIAVMRHDYLEGLLRNATLEGDESVKPYAEATIERVRIDPRNVAIGQTFVQRDKYVVLLEKFRGIMGPDFCLSNGMADTNAFIAYGLTADGIEAMAHYIPPVLEGTNGHYFLVDGIHRNFLIMQVGTTIESVVVRGVTVPLPCDTMSWGKIKIVDQKPPREERFKNLNVNYFRNLKHIGIDG